MATFTYKAIDPQGKQITGEIEATSEQDAVTKVRLRNLLPTKVMAKRDGMINAFIQELASEINKHLEGCEVTTETYDGSDSIHLQQPQRFESGIIWMKHVGTISIDDNKLIVVLGNMSETSYIFNISSPESSIANISKLINHRIAEILKRSAHDWFPTGKDEILL